MKNTKDLKISTMNCRSFREELPEIVLTPGATPGLAAVAHMKECPPCAEEYLSFQQTFAALDTWQVPEASPYFDQKLGVRLREVQAQPKMSWFESLSTRLLLNTGRGFRPALAGAMALALLVAGGGYAGFSGSHIAAPVQASATVNDLQILDRNEQAFQQMDTLQQDDDSSSQDSDDAGAGGGPTT